MADPLPYFYIEQTDVEKYLGVSLTNNGIAQFDLLNPLLQDMVDQYCNRTWNFANPVVEKFDALTKVGNDLQANYSFFIQKPPISTTPASLTYPLAEGIISVIVGTSLVDLNYIVSYGSFVKVVAAFPSVILANPLGFKMIQITYNSGAAQNVPNPVKAAMIMWLARLIQTSPDAGKETNKVQAGNVIAQYNADKINGIPDFVASALNPYVLAPLDHL
jgi:hypothetical protein